ncbi:MAG: amino acid ABC transporter permease [Oscillospiraceae bacterium]|nr:amino acid ABC transporter permease [Oscillospiraceae bacterium]
MDLELILQQMPVVVDALNEGFVQTLKLFFVTLLGAIPLGLLIAFGSMNNMRPLAWLLSLFHISPKGWVGAVCNFRPIRALSRFVVWIIRGTPLMIQLLILYFFPGMILKNNWWGSGETGRFLAASIAFIINYACYFSEIYRGGIQGVPVGQQEAGQVLGMTKRQIFFKVTLLQMVKRIVPPMSNEIITLVKDTSLARIISLQEIIWAGQAFMKTSRGISGAIWPLFFTAVYYLVFNGIVTMLLGKLERKLDYFR